MNGAGHQGISGFQPQWLNGLKHIRTTHSERLATLDGRPLLSTAVVKFAEDDDWYAECPVILVFEREQIEVCHQKFDDLSIACNTIDTAAKITGWDESDLTPVWRFDDDRLTPFHGQVLREVALLEYQSRDMANGMVAVEFVFGTGRIRIANALDENVIETSEPEPEYRRVEIAKQ